MNYLTKPILYNTGYLLSDNDLRLKQALMPQDLSSDCFNVIPNFSNTIYCKNCHGYLNNQNRYNAFKLAQSSTQNKIRGPMISTNLMYPIYNPPVTYGMPEIPTNCPCARYVQAP